MPLDFSVRSLAGGELQGVADSACRSCFNADASLGASANAIRVNALCPGPLRMELLMKFLDTEEKRRRLVHIPMGRFGLAQEIARAALFLASDASFITGTDVFVDGGITAADVTPE